MIAGIDYSTRAIDVVLLDEDTDAATWNRYKLHGQDAFERARDVRRAMHYFAPLWDDVLAFGIEDPRGYGAGSLYRVQGAILTKIPRRTLVYPWVPSAWRKAVGLPGNASKSEIQVMVDFRRLKAHGTSLVGWPQDACDAYMIALATRNKLERKQAA